MDRDRVLRDHLLALLQGENAHLNFENIVRDFPLDLLGVRPQGLPHSAWELLEHLRIAQWDILEFSRDPDHVSPEWPGGYWPQQPAPESSEAWNQSVAAFRRDLQAMADLVADPGTDLLSPIPWGGEATLLREALLVADHNAYHLGQLVMLRRLLGAWNRP